MNCANCGRENATHEYDAARVKSYSVLKKVGNLYEFRLAFYRLFQITGGGAGFRLWSGKGVRSLKPDFVTCYGDAHAYWLSRLTNHDVRVCTRRCALEFAAAHNFLLLRRTDGVGVTPQQAAFDDYAREHNLTNCLALMNEDEWTTPELELRGLMHARLQSPERLLALASAMIDEGKDTLAEQAVNKVVAEYPIDVSAQHCATILSRLGRHERIDELYEEYARLKGGRHRLRPEVLSTWAFGIAGHDLQKALTLSTEAVSASPSTASVIENHLSLLQMNSPRRAVEFCRDNSQLLTSDVGYYAAGKAFLKTGLLAEAEEYLRLSDALLPDPSTKSYLAEVLYRLGRYGEAQETCRDGRLLIEAFEIKAAADFDGNVRNASHYPYEQKKGLNKAFLAVEGKCLVAMGEVESGRLRIQDSLEMNLGFESQDVFYDQLPSLIGEYASRSTLEKALAKEQKSVAALTSEKQKSDKVARNLGDIISALAKTQDEWQDSLSKLKDAAGADPVAEHFASAIHKFCILLSNKDADRYRSLKENLRSEFTALPDRAIGQLANGEFLLGSHNDDSLPIFAGAIIEYCKALETAVNEIILWPFIRAWSPAPSRAELKSRRRVAR
jgi:tetratricopeptide (TPR) repeat protein